jgi:hypothetical protein
VAVPVLELRAIMSETENVIENQNRVERHCRWICQRLRENGVVTRSEFIAYFEAGNPASERPKLNSDWSRDMHAIKATLEELGIEVNIDEDRAALCRLGPLEPVRYVSRYFESNRDIAAKGRIGELVAKFLRDEELCGRMSVFLGSGSTIFHVGRRMMDHGPYKQLFVTVNVALASLWCEADQPPASKISIPEAVLETETFRFATLKRPGWTPAIAIVGADGCHYDEEKDEVFLFAMDDSIANNTNLFTSSATDLVICCLASGKIDYFGRNMGPRIYPPRKGVRLALVTDERPFVTIARAFEKGGWSIVTEYEHWKQLPKRQPPLSPLLVNQIDESDE